jgi:hypothetical protein
MHARSHSYWLPAIRSLRHSSSSSPASAPLTTKLSSSAYVLVNTTTTYFHSDGHHHHHYYYYYWKYPQRPLSTPSPKLLNKSLDQTALADGSPVDLSAATAVVGGDVSP